jgi:hypothetical protein
MGILSGQHSAQACIMMADQDLQDILRADAVVVGEVVKYEIIKNPDSGDLSDYALFTFHVKDLLKGHAPTELQFFWNNSTFGEPKTLDMTPDYVVALQEVGSKLPPLRGPSGYIPAPPRHDMMTVLQAPCASAFIFKISDVRAKTVLRMLGAKGYDLSEDNGEEKHSLPHPKPQ